MQYHSQCPSTPARLNANEKNVKNSKETTNGRVDLNMKSWKDQLPEALRTPHEDQRNKRRTKTTDFDLKTVSTWTSVLGYVRVSTDMQEASMESQTAAIRKYAADSLQLPVRRIYTDEGISGAKDETHRPGLAQLLRSMRKGEIIVVTEVSRLARSMDIAVPLLRQIAQAGCRFIELRTNLDTLDPASKSFLMFHATLAENEREMIRQRVKRGMEHCRSKGFVMSCPPYGYRVNPETRTLVHDTATRPVVERIIEMRREGFQYEKIADALPLMTDLGPPKAPRGGDYWQPQTVRNICERELGKELADSCGTHTCADVHDSDEDENSVQPAQTESKEIKNPDVEESGTELTCSRKADLARKPLPLLRILVRRKRIEIGISEEEVGLLSADDCVVLLTETV
eukprot:ANDGO_07309.mRNA.1 DNA-invertase from lambdoid prophage e14